jgi:hypothetical protein
MSTARLVEYTPGRYIALPPHTTLEVVENPRPVAVPGGAYYGHGLLAWQERQIPLVNLLALLKAHTSDAAAALPRYALVVAYQAAPGQPVMHGALGMAQLPQSVTVNDSDACGLPDDSDLWPLLALSCFTHEGQPAPIVDTSKLFGAFHG